MTQQETGDILRESTVGVTVLPSFGMAIAYTVFTMGGAIFLLWCMFLPGPIAFKALDAMLLVFFLWIGSISALVLLGVEGASCVKVTPNHITICSSFSEASLPWSEIERIGIEEDKGGEGTSYVVAAYSPAGDRQALFDWEFYPSDKKENADILAQWLEEIRRSDIRSRIGMITAAPDLLRIKGRA